MDRWRDYLTSTTHVLNLCTGVELALQRGRCGEVYFITDGDSIPFRSFASGLLATQGIVVKDKSVPRWLVRTIARLGDVLASVSDGRLHGPLSFQEFATMAVEITLNIDKARRELGYAPVITRKEGLAELTARDE